MTEELIRQKRKKYLEKYKDPRWQRIRLKVFERDNWTCQKCFSSESSLQVHHRFYLENKEPWEYPMEALVTLCEECHTEENEIRPIYEKELLLALREKVLAEDVKEIALGFKQLQMLHLPEVVASIYKWALTD
jgi:5-methylcytosine-specific restriction endonuclease McrA